MHDLNGMFRIINHSSDCVAQTDDSKRHSNMFYDFQSM